MLLAVYSRLASNTRWKPLFFTIWQAYHEHCDEALKLLSSIVSPLIKLTMRCNSLNKYLLSRTCFIPFKNTVKESFREAYNLERTGRQ